MTAPFAVGDTVTILSLSTNRPHRATITGGPDSSGAYRVRDHDDPYLTGYVPAGNLELEELPTMPACDMSADCHQPAAYVDDAGYVYCASHGLDRQQYRRCRKLRRHELNRLAAGQTVAAY